MIIYKDIFSCCLIIWESFIFIDCGEIFIVYNFIIFVVFVWCEWGCFDIVWELLNDNFFLRFICKFL